MEEIINKHDRGVIKGPQLIEKLKGDYKCNRDERIFLVKVLGKYLMEKCNVYVFKCVVLRYLLLCL